MTVPDGVIRCRKRPVELEVMEYTGENGPDVCQWIRHHGGWASVRGGDCILVDTPEGYTEYRAPMYVIRGIGDQFYAVSPDWYQGAYEEIEA